MFEWQQHLNDDGETAKRMDTMLWPERPVKMAHPQGATFKCGQTKLSLFKQIYYRKTQVKWKILLHTNKGISQE